MAASIRASSSGVRRRSPARALSRAWAALRAPQSEKVMPGCASVQAMTTCATSTPWTSVTGRSRSAKAADAREVAGGEPRVAAPQVVALEPPLRPDAPGQQAEREARIADDRDALRAADRQQRRLQPPVQHVVGLLHAIHPPRRAVGGEIVDAGVADADGAGLALGLQRQQRRHGLGDRRGRVLPMGDEDVDMVGAEPPQARLQFGADRSRAEVAVDRLAVLLDEGAALVGVPDQPAFGDQHHLVAPPGDGAADHLLGPAEPVGRRRVDQRDAGVERGADRLDRCGIVAAAPHPAAHRPGAEAERAGRYSARADVTIELHVLFLPVSPALSGPCGRR